MDDKQKPEILGVGSDGIISYCGEINYLDSSAPSIRLNYASLMPNGDISIFLNGNQLSGHFVSEELESYKS